MAEGLKKAAGAHELKIDPQCTSDATRLLRVPGTWNFKSEAAKPVTLIYGNDSKEQGNAP
jgi:hypothetical protein